MERILSLPVQSINVRRYATAVYCVFGTIVLGDGLQRIEIPLKVKDPREQIPYTEFWPQGFREIDTSVTYLKQQINTLYK